MSPYLKIEEHDELEPAKQLSVWIESYGCQMNFSDTEIGLLHRVFFVDGFSVFCDGEIRIYEEPV